MRAVLALMVLIASVKAQTYTVGDSNPATLANAITAANAYAGAATITINPGLNITLTGELPILRNPAGITINGNGSTINGGSTGNNTGYRVFFIGVGAGEAAVSPGLSATTATNWAINNLTIQNANARGGSGQSGGAGLGGGVFVNAGSLSLSGVNFSGNRAVGGAGGVFGAGSAPYFSGGGGMGGNSISNPGDTSGGGGFGIGADATNSAGSAGLFTGAAGGGASGSGAAGGAFGGAGGTSNNVVLGAGGGGVGGTAGGNNIRGDGGFGGGGGNGNGTGGAGGFGGGGGFFGAGGFGGGGGIFAAGGFGGGDGGDFNQGGGGGAGMGAAIFVRQGASVNIIDGSFSGGSVQGGPGANNGQGIGSGLLLAGSAIYTVSSGNTVTIADTLGGGVNTLITGGLTKAGPGTLALTGVNTFTGGVAINDFGTLAITADTSLGASSNTVIFNNGTLRTDASMTISHPWSISTGCVGIMNTNGFNVTLSGFVSGAGGLIKQGNGTLTLSNAGNSQANTRIDTGVLAISSDAHLGSSGGTIFMNGGTLRTDATMTIARPVTMLNGTAGVINTNGNDVTLSGVVGGIGGLIKQGGGTLTLTSTANSFTNMRIDAGTVAFTADSQLGATNSNVLFNSGTLQLTSGAVQTSANRSFILASDGTFNAATITTFLIVNGSVNGAFTLNLAGAGSPRFYGTIGSSTPLFRLVSTAGQPVFASNVTVGTGGVSIGGTSTNFFGTVRMTSIGSIDISSNVYSSGSTTATIISTGGTLTFGSSFEPGANSLFTLGADTITINGSVFNTNGGVRYALQAGAANRTIGVGDGASGTLALSQAFITKFNAASRLFIGATDQSGLVSVSTVSVGLPLTLRAPAGNVEIHGSLTASRDVAIDVIDVASAPGAVITTTNGLTVTNAGTQSLLAGAVSGTGGLSKAGAGTLTLSGANTYTGNTIVTGGTLALFRDAILSSPSIIGGTITVNSGSTLRFDCSNNLGFQTTTGADVVVNSGTITNSGGYYNQILNLTLNSATLTGVGGYIGYGSYSVRNTLTSTGTSQITLGTSNNGGLSLSDAGTTTFNVTNSTLTIDARVSDNNSPNAGVLLKAGSGTLVLTQANTFTGGTILNAGILAITSPNALGTGSLTVNSATLRTDAAMTLATPLAIGTSQVAFVHTNGNAVTLSGIVSGAGGFIKQGAGELTLTNANNSQGNNRIDSGTLTIGSNANLGEFGGPLFLNGGTLRTAGNSSTLVADRPLVLLTPSTIQTDKNLQWSGSISESGGPIPLVKTGTNTLFLANANNTWAGGITVNSGLLFVGNNSPGSLGSGPVVLNSGSLILAQTNPLTVYQVISGIGGVQVSGSGMTTVTAANTYTGGTNVYFGDLTVNSPTTPGISGTGTGPVSITAATLAGTGRIGGMVSVGSSGVIRGDSGTGTGRLILNGGVLFQQTGSGTNPTLAVQLATNGSGAITSSSLIVIGAATANFNIDLIDGVFRVLVQNDAGLNLGQAYTLPLATATASSNFQRNGQPLTNGFVFSTNDYEVRSANSTWSFANPDLSVNGGVLQLQFVVAPIPEPITIGVLATTCLFFVRLRRRETKRLTLS